MEREYGQLKGLVCEGASTILWFRPRAVPLWAPSDAVRAERVRGEADAALARRLMEGLPAVRAFLAAGRFFMRPQVARHARQALGVSWAVLVGTEGPINIFVCPIEFERRPLEWSIFPVALSIVTPERSSVALLTAEEAEELQLACVEAFGVRRHRMSSSEVYSPCHCFMAVRNEPELDGSLVLDHKGILNDPEEAKRPDLDMLVAELKRLKCSDFGRNRFGIHFAPLLEHLHIIIMNLGTYGLWVLQRAHFLRPLPSLFEFYENLHWVSRSERFTKFLLGLDKDGQPFDDSREVLKSFEAAHLKLNDWVRSFETKISAGIKQPATKDVQAVLAYDGLVPDRTFNLSYNQLVDRLGDASKCLGWATLTHAVVHNGITIQYEEEPVHVPFSELVNHCITALEDHSTLDGESLQIRWALDMEECTKSSGQNFCSTLKRNGLHIIDGDKQDLLQTSVGFVEGFTAPYFMCRRGGTFVGHTEQGGTAAFGCLLKQNGPSMKWEAIYVPFGPVFDSLRRVMHFMARTVDELPEFRGKGCYPGPLLWSDNPEGRLILQTHGIRGFYGSCFVQSPGKFALTSCSRIVDDYGLFVEYHQTSTVNDERLTDREPIVLFSQNAAPLANPSWCRQVMSTILADVSSDSVLQCWGLGFLAFCRSHTLTIASFDAIIESAKMSVFCEIVVRSLRDLMEMGPRAWRPRNLFKGFETFQFPYDLYMGTSVAGRQLFHQVTCCVCDFVIPALYVKVRNELYCRRCMLNASVTGYVWDIDDVLDLLERRPMSLDSSSPFMRPDLGLVGSEFCSITSDAIMETTTSDTFHEAQRILSHFFQIRQGSLFAGIVLEAGWRIPMTHAVHLRKGDAAKFVTSQINLPGCIGFGLMHYLRLAVAADDEDPNCELHIVQESSYVELIVLQTIKPGFEMVVARSDEE